MHKKWLTAIHSSYTEEQVYYLKNNFSHFLSFVLLLFLFIVNKPELFLIMSVRPMYYQIY